MEAARRPLRLLHLIPDFWPNAGGMESFVAALVRYGRTVGLDGRVLTMDRTAQHRRRLPHRQTINGIDVRRVGFVDLKYYKPLALPLEELRAADVLHVHGIGAMLDAAVALRALHGRPIVLSTHGGIFHTRRIAQVKELYFRLVRSLVLPRVDRVVASSQADLDLFGPANARTVLIENGVDLAPFRDVVRQGAGRREELVLFVGRHSPNKRLDRLIRAVASGRTSGAGIVLRLVGPGDEGRREAQRLARELGIEQYVEIAGEVPPGALAAEYARASVFASASEHEGFGIAAIEAMACGCAAALSDIPAYRPLATSGAATLIDFRDPAAAGAKLAAIAASVTPATREAARAVAARYDWPRTIPRWKALYSALISEYAPAQGLS